MARNSKVVPGSEAVINQWKYEIAAELGLPVGGSVSSMNTEFATELGIIPSSQVKKDYWGHISSRDAGAVGGAITRKLIQQAQQSL